MNNNIEQQKLIEEEAIGIGVKSYREALLERGEDNLPSGLKLIKTAIEPLAVAIKKAVDDGLKGKASRSVSILQYLSQFDSEAVAFVTAKGCIEHIHNNSTVQKVAMVLASRLEGMLNYDKLRKEEPRAHRRLMAVLKAHPNLGTTHRHVVIRKQQQYAEVKRIKWDRGEKLRLGTLLVHIMCDVTGLTKLDKRIIAKKKQVTLLVPTEATTLWLEKSHARCELLSPFYMPMVCKPQDWSTPFDGGYVTEQMKYGLVKTANKTYLNDLCEVDMPIVYEAINALQSTAWTVNKAVYNVINKVWEGGGVLGKLPSVHDEPMPPMNYDPDLPENLEKHKAWKKKASNAHEINFRTRSKRVQLISKLWVAEKFNEYEHFYFPHALDWRGRAYPVSACLNPQGDDSAKALLKFAEGKPLGENGSYWLAMHGANCYGVDKVAFNDRIRWVEDNFEKIVECAVNPLDGSRFWCEADQPYQFLAFCFEWLGFSIAQSMGAGKSYVSHLPIAFDGTCNGLQNFSAMLRDEIGGKAVGLVPTDTPPDVYKDVLTAAEILIAKDAEMRIPMGVKWTGKLVRGLTKQNTMTTPYGVSEYGMKDQLMNAFTKLRDDGHDFGFETDLEDAMYLSKINYMAISNTVVAARLAMDWLKEAAIVAASNDLPVSWTTPSGLPVLQSYRKAFGKRFDFDIEGKRYQIMLKIEGDDLNRRKQSSGIAPNFVHSLDAAHLMRTVSYSLDEGVTSFSMVHDSYGTHAADADTLSYQLRRAFVDQYESDVLTDFREQLISTLPEKLMEKITPLPPRGNLDLAAVLDSEYFFA